MRGIAGRACALASAALSVVLASCSGGSHATVVPRPAATSAATNAQQKIGSAQFRLLIPNKPASASGARHAQYVSAATLSATITVDGGSPVQLDLGSGSGNCSTATNGRTCLIAAPAPIGLDTFALTLYDGPFTAGQATGTALSTAAGFTATVAEGKSNVTTPLVLSGIPAYYALTVTQQPVAYQTSGSGAQGAAVLDVYDNDMNLIVAPGTYADAGGNVTGFTIGLSSSNYQLALNNGAAAYTQAITSPSDVLTITQTHATLGAQLTVTPDVVAAQSVSDLAFIRPTQFTTSDIESAAVAGGSSGSQLAPIFNQTYGVAGFANYAAIGMFTTGSGAATATTCGTGYVRSQDFAANVGSGWNVQGATAFTYDYAGCNANSQFPAQSVVGYGTGILDVDATCTANYQYTPGVEIAPGGGAPPNCSNIHDLTDGKNGNYYAAVYKNTSTNDDDVAVYDVTTFYETAALTNTYATAAAGSIAAIAARPDYFFAEELPAARLWSFPQPHNGIGGTPGFITLPGGYTYVSNPYVVTTSSYSERTMAIGSDGLLYVAVSSPSNGVVIVDPRSGDPITFLPNAAGASGNAPFNVVSDERGTIYWSAGSYVMHYPSNVNNT